MMLAIQIIAWFVFGFIVAALLLYGPVLVKAYRVKAEAIGMMKDSTQKLHESAAMAKDYAGYAKEIADAKEGQLDALRTLADLGKEHGELQQKYICSLDDYKILGEEALSESKDYGRLIKEHSELLEKHSELLEKYEQLLIDHKALLWRAGGGVEGTA